MGTVYNRGTRADPIWYLSYKGSMASGMASAPSSRSGSRHASCSISSRPASPLVTRRRCVHFIRRSFFDSMRSGLACAASQLTTSRRRRPLWRWPLATRSTTFPGFAFPRWVCSSSHLSLTQSHR